MEAEAHCNRRNFIGKGLGFAFAATLGVTGLATSCKEKEDSEKEVSPPEDLMQEHGVLNRILLIYDHCKIQLADKRSFDLKLMYNAADIIRTFVEDYHEKQEENYLFPRFEKAGQLTDLVSTLRVQHQAGRSVTDQILQITRSQKLSEQDDQKLIELLSAFNRMYRPHEAREDTILFPAFRKIVSRNEYDSTGEEFEKNEHKLFGEDGFEMIVSKVEAIERSLGIYDLSAFTPK